MSCTPISLCYKSFCCVPFQACLFNWHLLAEVSFNLEIKQNSVQPVWFLNLSLAIGLNFNQSLLGISIKPLVTSLPVVISTHFLRTERWQKDLTKRGQHHDPWGGGRIWGLVDKWWGQKGKALYVSVAVPYHHWNTQTDRCMHQSGGDVRCPTCAIRGPPDRTKQRPSEVICIWKSLTCCGRGCVVGWIDNRPVSQSSELCLKDQRVQYRASLKTDTSCHGFLKNYTDSQR